MFFLASSFWHVNFSRMAFRAILDPFLSALAIVLVCTALSRGRHGSLGGLAGASLGLGLYGYATFKFMVFPVLFLIICAFLQNRPHARRQTIIILLGTLVVSSPLLLFVLQNPDTYFHRLESVSIFSKELPLAELFSSTTAILQMFFAIGDPSPRHNLNGNPQLHPIVFLFFAMGLTYIVNFYRKTNKSTEFSAKRTSRITSLESFICVFWVSMLIPPILTHQDHPHSLRAIGLILPTAMIAGFGVGLTAALLRRFALQLTPAWLFAAALIVQVISLDVVIDYHYRFAQHPYTAEAFNLRVTESARKLLKSPAGTTKLIVVEDGRLSKEHWAVQQFLFLAGDDLSSVNASLIEASDLSHHEEFGKALIFTPHRLEHIVAPMIDNPDRLIVYYSSVR